MRQQRSCRIGCIERRYPSGQFLKPVLHVANHGRRRIERETEHGRGESADRWRDRSRRFVAVQTRRNQPERGQRVLQKRVAALERLDQILLPGQRRREMLDKPCRRRVDGGRFLQPDQRGMQGIRLPHQRIVVAQHAGPGAKDIPVQRGLHRRKLFDLAEHAIELFRVGVGRAQRQPGQQQDDNRDRRQRRYHPHGDAAATGAPR